MSILNVQTLVKEYKSKLTACSCGEQPWVSYEYDVNYAGEPGKKHPHKFYVKCTSIDCPKQTDGLCAEDDEDDVKEALRILLVMWNNSSDARNDSAIAELYKPQYCSFKSQEEAKAYFEGRGESYDENVHYLGVVKGSENGK